MLYRNPYALPTRLFEAGHVAKVQDRLNYSLTDRRISLKARELRHSVSRTDRVTNRTTIGLCASGTYTPVRIYSGSPQDLRKSGDHPPPSLAQGRCQ